MSSNPSSFTGKPNSNNNALDMLMQGKGRKLNPVKKRGGSTSSSSSKPKPRTNPSIGFVECPAGCGAHVANLDHLINQHLDKHCSVMVGPTPTVTAATPKAVLRTEEFLDAIHVESVTDASSPTNTPETSQSDATSTPQEDSERVDVVVPTPVTTETSLTTKNDRQLQSTDAPDSTDKIHPSVETILEKSATNSDNLPSSQPTQSTQNNATTTSSTVSPEQSQPKPRPQAPKPNNNPYHGTNSKRNLKRASNNTGTVQPSNNVFVHMMKKSKTVFATSKPANEIPQHFSLQYDPTQDSFSLQLDTTPPLDAPPPLWTCTVQIKDKPNQSVVGLTLSVSCTPSKSKNPTSPHRPRYWIQNPSRLSVPVLKSILQKSVRRRRPLPSVRVAMELMDKALGELVRRIPIIILEDSTLHPDFALVVWMMIAHSKGFFDMEEENPQKQSAAHVQLIGALKLRLLRIVYQVASCPVQDHLSAAEEGDEVPDTATTSTPPPPPPKPSQPSLSEPFLSDAPHSSRDLQLSIWAMLVRAQYGGMACDVTMLQGFAQLWQDRMKQNVPTVLGGAKEWSQVPAHVHAAGMAQSLTRISAPTTTTAALDRLQSNDLCKEGVDFHCSPLVNSLLQYSNISRESMDVANQLSIRSQELLLKRCIWKFSAGVNLRRPLIPPEEEKKDLSQTSIAEEPLKGFWNDFLQVPVASFQTRYIEQRISKR